MKKPVSHVSGHTMMPNPATSRDVQSAMGDAPALEYGRDRRRPDRRRVSARWLIGSVLTGVTSVLLMGGALHAAFDGRQKLAQPADFLDDLVSNQNGRQVFKGDRPVAIVSLKPAQEKILQVPTVSRDGNSNVIRKKPFGYASAPLATAENITVKYPAFNPLTVFRASGTDKVATVSNEVIYGADIEGEVRLELVPFPVDQADAIIETKVPLPEAASILQTSAQALSDGSVQTASLAYRESATDPISLVDIRPEPELEVKIVAENVSTAEQDDENASDGHSFDETVIVASENQTLAEALSGLNLQPTQLEPMIEAISQELGDGPLAAGTRLRVAFEQKFDSAGTEEQRKICRRISLYNNGRHEKSIALTDEGTVVWANEPSPIPAVLEVDETEDAPAIATVSSKNLPNVYDGLYRAALSQNLSVEQARRIVRTVAFDVDFRTRIKPDDELEIFYSLEDGQEVATDMSEILYIGLTLSGKRRTYYRFASGKDGKIDYYTADGNSPKKFLLRKPVPNGKFRSSFGPRRHPISRVVKMHYGVDFSAPRGTRILAAGNGVVEKAGWNAGYGRQTVIRHPNGYKTSYSHQHRIARGIRPGARVVQGQVIGQVGSTGYSTGPHLHYEVIVNGSKVNPMKIRLPNGKRLKGKELAAFKTERNRINALLKKARGEEGTIASIN